jgi:hypothetical protein
MNDTHGETRKILKNEFVILARSRCRRTERRERHGLSRGGGGGTVGETGIIGTGRKGRRRTRSAPGGLAAKRDGKNANGRGEGGRGKDYRVEGLSPGKPFLVGFGCRTVAAM